MERFQRFVKIQLFVSSLLIIALIIGLVYLKKELDAAKKEIKGYREFFERYKRDTESPP